MHTSISIKLLIVASVITSFLLIIFLTTDLIQQVKIHFEAAFLDKKAEQVIFYQWTNQHGEMIISQNKPDNNQQYITFQASSDLIKNENVIDHALIKQGNEYRQLMKENGKKRVSEREMRHSKFPEDSPLNAAHKAKKCVELSYSITEAATNGADTNKLRKQHEEECQ